MKVWFLYLGKLKGTRHWDWLGQALDAGYDKPIMSKEQLLLERRQRLQGKIQRVSDRPLPKSQSGTNPSYTQSYLSQ